MSCRDREGSTCVEALVALPIGLLVCGMAVGLLWMGFFSLSRSEECADRNDRGIGALTSLRTSLRDARAYAARGPVLRFVTAAGEWEASFDSDSGKLSMTEPGGKTRALVPAGATAFEAKELAPGLVRLSLELAGERRPGTKESAAPLKLHDDILVHAVAGRAAAPCWNAIAVTAAAF